MEVDHRRRPIWSSLHAQVQLSGELGAFSFMFEILDLGSKTNQN